nr:unnamed protein product [Spirometra erinaceieuropaei]
MLLTNTSLSWVTVGSIYCGEKNVSTVFFKVSFENGPPTNHLDKYLSLDQQRLPEMLTVFVIIYIVLIGFVVLTLVQHDPVSVGVLHVPHGLPKEDPLIGSLIITKNTMGAIVSKEQCFVQSDASSNPLQTLQGTFIPPLEHGSLRIITSASLSIPAMEATSAGVLEGG